MGISAISAAFPTLIEPLEKASIAAATLTSLSDRNSGTLTCTTLMMEPPHRMFSARLTDVSVVSHMLAIFPYLTTVRCVKVFWFGWFGFAESDCLPCDCSGVLVLSGLFAT